MKKASKTVTDKRVGKKVAKTKAQIPPKTKPPPPPNKKQPAPIIRKQGRKKDKTSNANDQLKQDDDDDDDDDENQEIKDSENKMDLEQQKQLVDPYQKVKNITQWQEYSILRLQKEILVQIENKHRKDDEEQICPICKCELYQRMLTLSEQQFQEIDDLMLKGQIKIDVVKFKKCQGHWIHKDCAEQLRQNYDFVQCPICLIIYGTKTGDQPDGAMNSYIDSSIKCSGYTCDTIVINYQFDSGVQNGVRFSGTHRTAYLPNNEEGQQILKLLKLGFTRRLLFTIGTSVTTGMSNCVIWNGVHHKTNPSGGSSNYGFPDATYFTRVKQELAVKGIFIEQAKDDYKIQDHLVNATDKNQQSKLLAKRRKVRT